jgi:hypothetical protein
MRMMPSWSAPPPKKKVDLVYWPWVFDFIACLQSSAPQTMSHDILSKSPDQIAATRIRLWLLLLLLLLLFLLPSNGGLRHKTGGSGFDSRQWSWKFSSLLFLLSAFSSPWVLSASNKCVSRHLFGGKVWPARGAENSIVLVVPNVNVRMEVQHQIPPLWDFMTCYWNALSLLKLLLIFLFTNSDANIFSYHAVLCIKNLLSFVTMYSV